MRDPKVEAFLADILVVYKKHNMSISYDDFHGVFYVEDLEESNIEWLGEARDCRLETRLPEVKP